MDNERKGAPQYDSLDEKVIMLGVLVPTPR